MHHNNEMLQQHLSHVYWLGGSPCSGKSSIADKLAQTYDLQLYRCDDAFFRHEKIVTLEQQPTFYRVAHLTSEELWIQRPVEQQVVEEIALYREEFSLLLAELSALPRSKPILAEGAALLPECVQPLLCDPQHAMWIVPTREFQLEHYARREWAKDIVKGCSDPEQAFRNWMERDVRFASFVVQDAMKLGLNVLVADGRESLLENTNIVAHHLHLDSS